MGVHDQKQRLERDGSDPERVAFTELRRQYGRDLDAWPAEDRERFVAWQRRQEALKSERDAQQRQRAAAQEAADADVRE